MMTTPLIKNFYKKIGGWVFRLSVLEDDYMMIFVNNTEIADSFMVRFFSDEEAAGAWVDEVSMGKRLD